MSRIRLGLAHDEKPLNIYSDSEWAGEHRLELLEKYGEGILLIYQKKVIGQGKTIEDAQMDAERNLSPDSNEITPIIHFSGYRHRIHHLRFKKDE